MYRYAAVRREVATCDIPEKNEGVKKAPQAHGGGPLWSFRKYDPLVIRFHPLVKYEINVQRWPFRGGLSDDFVVDTIGSGKVLSPLASQGRARRWVPPMDASESDDDDGGGVLLVDNASDDDDFVAKDSARALQSLFRSSDGYDEELARVQRGETEDGDDLYD